MTDAPGDLIAIDEAQHLLATLPRPRRARALIPLDQACGRVLAAPIAARWPMPRFATAAVDGWAVASADLVSGGATRLPIRGRLAAGEDAAGHKVAGGAIRIFTGAMMPAGADTVVMQEDATAGDGHVTLPPTVQPTKHVRLAGEQARAGTILLAAGRRLRAPDLALAAAGGASAIETWAPLRVGVLATGREVRAISAPLDPAAIPDANSAMIGATLARWGAVPVPFGIVGDDPDALAARLSTMAADYDLVITTGGVSVGEEDHLRAAVTLLGRLLFSRIAMKPGRPTALGLIGDVPILALPGHPAAAFTALRVLGPALIRHLSGETPRAPATLPARAAFAHHGTAELADVLPVTLQSRDGALWATRTDAARGSLAALAEADALALVEASRTTLDVGDVITVMGIDSAW